MISGGFLAYVHLLLKQFEIDKLKKNILSE